MQRFLAALPLLLSLACSPGVNREPAVPAAPVEAEPEATPAAPAAPLSGRPVDASTLAEIGACWFRGPYDYMFTGSDPVTISGKSYGMLVAGIGGILYYGDLNQCFAEEAGTQAKSYSDNDPFAALAGLPLHSDLMDGSRPFGYYNPDLVTWGHENLIPAGDATIAGVRAQVIYSRVFSRFFRMMTEAYLHLVNTGTYQDEMDAYMAMAKSGQDGIDYLQARYTGKLPQYGGAWDGTTMTPQMAIGFWLRRGLDGTSDELWTGLRKVITRFDADWYASLRATYASGAIDW